MDAQQAWDLFAATGLPQAYDLYAELKNSAAEGETEAGEPTATGT